MIDWRKLGLQIAVIVGWSVSAPAVSADVVVFAPGALEESLTQTAQAAKEAGKPFKLVIGHSPAQARQIVDGAPADIFISADPQWMDFLDGKHLLANEPIASLASTRLVLVAPAASGMTYAGRPDESLATLLGDGKLAIADPDMVPAGRFAQVALEKLGQWNALQGKLAMLPHVRAVIAMIERHEVPAGIGFASDVAGDDKLRVVTPFSPEVAPPLDFPLAIIAGHQRDDVMAVARFIKGPEGLTALRAHGFSDPTR